MNQSCPSYRSRRRSMERPASPQRRRQPPVRVPDVCNVVRLRVGSLVCLPVLLPGVEPRDFAFVGIAQHVIQIFKTHPDGVFRLMIRVSFHRQFTAVISNTDSTATSSGTLHLTTNALFTFVSRTDIQNWAENNAPIPTPNELGSVDVPSIAPSARTSPAGVCTT